MCSLSTRSPSHCDITSDLDCTSRLCDHSSSILCDLYAILAAVNLMCQSGVNAALIFDSVFILQSLSVIHPILPSAVPLYSEVLTLMSVRHLDVKFD